MNDLIFWLLCVCALSSVLWSVYILNSFFINGIFVTMEYPPKLNFSAWAERAKKAHANAIENLAIFAPLVLIFLFLAKERAVISPEVFAIPILAAKIYFFARLSHFGFYVFKIPYLRTLAFLAGFGCQVYFMFAIHALLSQ